MKRYLLMPALLGLAFLAHSAVAQSTVRSQKSTNRLWELLQLPAPAKTTTVRQPGQDAVTLGYARAKTYKLASADYPGADLSLVFDETTNTVLGTTEFGIIAMGFTLQGGNYQLLSIPDSTLNQPTAINTSGQIVGVYIAGNNTNHGFLDTAGIVTNVDDPNAIPGTTNPFDINDAGEIVGFYEDSVSNHGFFTTDGITFNSLDFPGATLTDANGVNSAGEIVGTWTNSAGIHGFLYNNGVFSSIDFPLALATTALSINDNGEIAGAFSDVNNVQHGFIFSGTQFSQFDVPGASDTDLIRIKNNGNIAGFYVDAAGEMHGFTGH